MREWRRSLPPLQRIQAAESMADRLRTAALLPDAGYVGGYWAMDGELSLHALLAPSRGFLYCLPILLPDRSLRFGPWRPGDPLESNRFGIPEPQLAPASTLAPQDLEAVLLPLLAFDRSGNRLGTGGGYYDRSFAFLNTLPRAARPRLIGAAYAGQEVDALPCEPWDVALDWVVTEHEAIECGVARES